MARKLVVEIIGDASSLERSFKQAGAQTRTFGSTLSRTAKIAGAAAGGAAIAGLTVALRAGIEEWTQSTKVAAQTEAVLKSTGGVAGITAKHVDELATSIMKKSGIDDEAIKSSENLLLAFTKVRNEAGKGNDVFDRAITVITDYSVRTGKSAAGATQLFGKALNEIAQGQIPASIRGIGKLSKATRDEIKAHLDAGDAAGAQGVLLDQLEKKYGGAAEAAGKTLPGQIAILRESFNNLAGQGVALAVQKLEELRPTIEGLVETIKTLEPVLRPLATLFFDIFVTPMKVVVDLLQGDWTKAWQDIKKPVEDAIGVFTGVWTLVGPELEKLGNFFVNLPGKIAGTLGDLGSTALTPFRNMFTAAKTWVGEKIDQIVAFFTGLPGRIAGTLAALGSEAIAPFKAAFTGMKTWVGDRVDDIVGFFTGLPGKLRGLVGQIGGAAAAIGSAIYNGIVDAMEGFGKELLRIITWPINKIIDGINRIKIPGFSFSVDTHLPGIGTVGFSFPGVDPFPGDIPHLAKGGIVTAPTMALLGERGPEAVVPLNRGAGFGNLTVIVEGTVVSERKLVDAIHEGLLRKGNRNAGLGFA